MTWRFGPGPVFAVELVAAARRWQTFAARCGLVVILLIALGAVYASETFRVAAGNRVNIKQYAEIGAGFATVILMTQLALVLLAAPAAAAGAVCQDKARGNLTHLMVTELTSSEIILGKLFARLIPVLSLVAASLPVLAITSLLGGIDGRLLLGGFAVLVGATVFACALALCVSVWVGRTHEALLIAYFVILAWLLAYPVYAMATKGPLPQWLPLTNPFGLLYAPASPSGLPEFSDYAVYLTLTLGSAAVLTAVAARQLRPVALAEGARPVRQAKRPRRRDARSRRLLDAAPLRWYERHRRRPGRAARVVQGIYLTAAAVGAAWAVACAFDIRRSEVAPFVILFIVGVGHLLTTVAAVTALAEERAGGLDVLLTTPVATRDIVAAKWRAAFRTLRAPVVLAVVVAVAHLPGAAGRTGFLGQALSIPAAAALLFLCVVYPLASGAALVSLGLYLATTLRQFGRAVGLAVTLYVVLAAAWPFFLMAVTAKTSEALTLIVASPPFGSASFTAILAFGSFNEVEAVITGGILWTLVSCALAGVLYSRTVIVFDRCVGRLPARGLRPRRPPVKQPEQVAILN